MSPKIAMTASLAAMILSVSAVDISVPSTAPSSAMGPIDRSFTGFAFEEASFYNYSFTETGQPNTFSQNLVNSVLSRTGGTPLIRVGGTSGDGGKYDPTQNTATNFPATEYGPRFGGDLKIGPSFWSAFNQWPGAKFEFMVPLWHQDLDNTLQWAKAGLDAIGDNLYALEIGNEPNFYSWFTVQKYVDTYQKFETALKQEFPSLAKGRMFQALDTAWGAIGKLPAKAAFDAGLAPDSLKQIGLHFYQGQAPSTYGDFEKWILHSNLVSHLAPFADQVSYMKKNHIYIDTVLSESADGLGVGGAQFDNTTGPYHNNLATAVWGVDFFLQSMSIGVDRINMQNIVKPGFGMWEPVASSFDRKLVRANYYVMPFVADFIGKSGNTKVAPLTLSDDNGSKLAAYAAYDNGKLARIAVLNVDLWRSTDNTARPSSSFTLSGLGGAKTATLHHLNAPGGALAQTNLTWRGIEWTVASNGNDHVVRADSTQLTVNGGKVTFSVDASSAVMIEL